MLFGMTPFTLFHVAISLIGIFSGFIAVFGMIAGKRLDGWTALFLVTTALTSITGFFFPFHKTTINLAPADVRKEGASFDLPIALGILGANGDLGDPVRARARRRVIVHADEPDEGSRGEVDSEALLGVACEHQAGELGARQTCTRCPRLDRAGDVNSASRLGQRIPASARLIEASRPARSVTGAKQTPPRQT